MKNSTINTALIAAIVIATGKCSGPKRHIRGPHRRQQEHEQEHENHDVGANARHVLFHR